MPNEHWSGKNVDLSKLVGSIEDYCKINGFSETRITVDPSAPPSWFEIQAMKTGALRTVIGARRCLDIVIKGNSNDFEIHLGTADWGKNMAAAVITGALTLGLGFLAGGASAAAYKHFENQLWNFIKNKVNDLQNTATPIPSPPYVPPVTPQPFTPPSPPASLGQISYQEQIEKFQKALSFLENQRAMREVSEESYNMAKGNLERELQKLLQYREEVDRAKKSVLDGIQSRGSIGKADFIRDFNIRSEIVEEALDQLLKENIIEKTEAGERYRLKGKTKICPYHKGPIPADLKVCPICGAIL